MRLTNVYIFDRLKLLDRIAQKNGSFRVVFLFVVEVTGLAPASLT